MVCSCNSMSRTLTIEHMTLWHIILNPSTYSINTTYIIHGTCTTIKGDLDKKKAFISGTYIAMINSTLAKCHVKKTSYKIAIFWPTQWKKEHIIEYQLYARWGAAEGGMWVSILSLVPQMLLNRYCYLCTRKREMERKRERSKEKGIEHEFK